MGKAKAAGRLRPHGNHNDNAQRTTPTPKMVDVGSGLESLDVASLHVHQQDKLLRFKINTKIANEKYLRSHKEVELLLSGFVREVLMQRPENIREFAADYFTNPDLPKKIETQMREKLNQAL